MKKIALAYYRDWAQKIFVEVLRLQEIRNDFEVVVVIVTESIDHNKIQGIPKKLIRTVDPQNSDVVENILLEAEVDLVLFYGWSWFIPSSIYSSTICVCLHPSKLPEFRGGSPLQNQVLAGVSESAVTLFRMNSGVDEGPVYKQEVLSLCGPIKEVFERIVSIGKVLTKELLADFVNNELSFTDQLALEKDVVVRRRKPSDSEITVEEIKDMTFANLCRFVDVLGDPYPNAFLIFGVNRLLIKEVHKYRVLPQKAVLITGDLREIFENEKYFFETFDGFAFLSKWELA